MPCFSIVVPVYNTEPYLAQCLESILAQTCEDYEIIIVNDGSTDGSCFIIDEYKDRYPDKIKVVNQTNRGLLLARRAGFANSSGKILMTVDSDDYIRADALELVQACFDTYGADVVSFGFSRDPDFSSMSSRAPFDCDTLIAGDEKIELFRLLCTTRTMNFLCCKAIKREHVGIDIDFSEYLGLSCAEDLLQTLPVLDSINSYYFLHQPLYYYRYNEASITQVFSMKKYWENQRAGLARARYAEKWESNYSVSGLIIGSLFMSLRESCETIVGVAVNNSVEEAKPLYNQIEQGELFKRSSCSIESVKLLHPFYQLILRMYQRKLFLLVRFASQIMLAIKKRFQKIR